MLACLDTDLDAIFGTDDFGEYAILAGVQIVGHFDDEDVEASMGEGPTQIVPQPKFTCRAPCPAELIEGMSFVVRDVPFTVKNWKNDGVGVIILFLERV